MEGRPVEIQSHTGLVDARDISLGEAIEAFLRLEMVGKSAQTVRWYRTLLGMFAREMGEETVLATIQEVDVLEWQAKVFACKHFSAYTLSARIRTVRSFLRWLKRKDVLAADLGAELKLPRLPRGTRGGISEANVTRLLEAARGCVRDYAILSFMESTGCRRGGVARLSLEKIDLDNPDERLSRRALVMEKGEKERAVVMDSSARQALRAWLQERPAERDEHVFLGFDRKRQRWAGLQPAAISEIVRRYSARVEISGKTSPHQWRHRWARKAIQDGMDLSQVSQLLGHADSSITVKFYGQFTIDQLQEAYDRVRDGKFTTR